MTQEAGRRTRRPRKRVGRAVGRAGKDVTPMISLNGTVRCGAGAAGCATWSERAERGATETRIICGGTDSRPERSPQTECRVAATMARSSEPRTDSLPAGHARRSANRLRHRRARTRVGQKPKNARGRPQVLTPGRPRAEPRRGPSRRDSRKPTATVPAPAPRGSAAAALRTLDEAESERVGGFDIRRRPAARQRRLMRGRGG